MAEEICPVGYINEEMKHGMISIKNPTMTNGFGPKLNFVQIVLTIDSLCELKNQIIAFLNKHGT